MDGFARLLLWNGCRHLRTTPLVVVAPASSNQLQHRKSAFGAGQLTVRDDGHQASDELQERLAAISDDETDSDYGS